MIYFDNAATTRTDALAVDALKKYGLENFYNPSALYKPALDNSKVLNEARSEILSLLHGDGDLIFTASGTEADNMALFGAKKSKTSRIIISSGEHAAVRNPALALKNKGFDVQFAPLNGDGSVNLDEFKKLLNADVALVSVMHVNNETGAVNDVSKIVKLTKAASPMALVHSDGVQALGKVYVNLLNLGVDMYSVSAHKVHAPRGVGALYIKRNVNISPLILGGGQEKGMRSATENLAGIVAFSNILQKYLPRLNEDFEKRRAVLERIRERIKTELPETAILSPDNSPHILMLALKGVRGEVMLHSLEEFGIYIGVGSACSSKKGINKFQTLLGLDEEHKEGIIRISVSEENTLAEADEFVDKLILLQEKLSRYGRV